MSYHIPLPSKDIADAYAGGETLVSLASQYGCSFGTIRRAIVSEGVSIRPKAVRPAWKRTAVEDAAEHYR